MQRVRAAFGCKVGQGQSALVLLALLGMVLLALALGAAGWAAPSAEVAARAASACGGGAVKTIVDLQRYCESATIAVPRSGGGSGSATLIDLNRGIRAWYLLELDLAQTGARQSYHLENPFPHGQSLRLDEAHPYGVVIDSASGRTDCDLWSGAPSALEQASRKTAAYAELCGGRLYLRNPVQGRSTRLEQATDFLRQHVWGGEKIIGFVRREFFADAFLQPGAVPSGAPQVGAETPQEPDAPAPAALEPDFAATSVLPEHLDIDLEGAPPGAGLLLGRWYRAKGLPGVHVSAIQPLAITGAILRDTRWPVNPLDKIESGALDYLVAFDLAQFDLGFALGTVHPRVGWSAHALEQVRDQTLPGPDGIGTIEPLVANGMVPPWLVGRTVATFTGGFKRDHGAFAYGDFARRNRGSHYGFAQQGVLMSSLIAGLSTLYVLDDGQVVMKTWEPGDEALLPRIRDARQNGVPLIEYDQASGISHPGALVARWGQGNWSASAEEQPRTLRAGACMQVHASHRFLIYGYFSGATPSAMARVFQAYGCRYAMHLDMNALEHTYLALYLRKDEHVEVEHLIDDMSQLDVRPKKSGALVPRFLGVPDDRDFFFLTRKGQAP